MANEDYAYSIADDTALGEVNLESLEFEIQAAELTSAAYLWSSAEGDDLTITFDAALSLQEKNELDVIVSLHEPVPLAEAVPGMLLKGFVPGTPTVEVMGTGGSTSWGYCVTAFSGAGESMASEEGAVSDGPAELSEEDHCMLSWEAVPGARYYAIYRTTAGGTPSEVGRIGVSQHCEYHDHGWAAGDPPPSEDGSSALRVGVGVEATPHGVIEAREITTDNSTVTSLLALARRCDDVVDAGFGTGIYVRLDDAGGTLRDAAGLHVLWSDPDPDAKEADFRVMLRDGGSSLAERLRLKANGDLELAGVSVVKVETCRIGIDIGGGVRGGTTSGSSNNDIAAVRYDTGGEGYQRFNVRFPQNRTSGDYTLRLFASVPASIAAGKGARWKTEWASLADADSLPGSWPNSHEFTKSLSSMAADTIFSIDFTIGSSTISGADDFLALKITRLGAHANDDCAQHIYVHAIELRYTGRAFCGQPGG